MNKLVYGTSIRGNGHFISGVECQDSNSFTNSDFNNDEVKTIALSDGHGGVKHIRSAIGSKYAVEVSKNEMHNFIETHKVILDKIDLLSNELNLGFVDNYDKIKEYILTNNEEIKNLREATTKEKAIIDRNKEIINLNNNSEMDKESNENIIESTKELYYANNALVKEYNKKAKLCNQKINENKKIIELYNSLVEIENDLKNLKKIIINKWNDLVDDHMKKNPISVGSVSLTKISSFEDDVKEESFIGFVEESKDKLKIINMNMYNTDISDLQRNYRQLYGATLLCVGSYKNHNFLIQLGDGNTIVVDKDNNVSKIFKKAEHLMVNETYSLCQKNALDYFEEMYFNKETNFIMINTDGIENALENEEDLNEVALEIYHSIQTEPETFKTDLLILMREFSKGSSDDCTICFIANNISDDVYKTFVESKEEPEANNLSELYIAPFKDYVINKMIYPIEGNLEDQPIDFLSKYDFSKIGKMAATSVFKDLEKPLSSIISAKKELEKTKWISSILLPFKKIIKENINESIEKWELEFKDKYVHYLNNIISEHPVVLVEYSIIRLSLNEENVFESEYKEINYGMVSEINNDVITSTRIIKENYDNIVNDLQGLMKFVGLFINNEDYEITIDKYNIKVN